MKKSMMIVLVLVASCVDEQAPSSSSDVTVPLRTRAEVDAYLTHVNESPLDRLGAASRERFLRSLTFTERGLASYYYGDLKMELNDEEARSILRLFDVESTWGPRTGVLPVPPDGWPDMYCPSPGNCAPKYKWICTTNC